jgi:hypothetical protein
MHQRYVITILPQDEPLPAAVVFDPDCRETFTVGEWQVVVDTPDAPRGEGLRIAAHELPGTLTITEGIVIAAGTPDWPQSGTYNQLIVSAAGEARLHNDTLGLLACFFARSGRVVRITNSLRLLRHCGGLDWDELGIAEMFLFAGWTPTERTIVRSGQRVAAGTEYRFRLDRPAPPAAKRLARTWTGVIDEPLPVVIDRVCDLWQTSVARHIDSIDTPIGLMLSGGLDSRMVAGAVASRGKQLVGLTYGDLGSDEVRIAGEVAAAVGARWLPFGLDESFPFEGLTFEKTNYSNETMYPLMWDPSLPRLVAAGVTHFTTGATFETTFGGQRDANPRRRLLKSLRGTLLGPWDTGPATAAELDALIESVIEQARKRVRNFCRWLVEPYRSQIAASVPAIRDEVAARLSEMAASGPISIGQIRERFDSEHYQMHHSRDQERQLLNYGALTLPTCDRDVADYLTNLPAGMKYDHALYYRVFRRLYPQLAAIQVPNLSTGLNKSQLHIELTRAWHIRRQTRLTPWVNFTQWMLLDDNLAKYERVFLDQPAFFDADATRAHFAEVRTGRRSLYDGGETSSFLNLAYLLDERIEPVYSKVPAGFLAR